MRAETEEIHQILQAIQMSYVIYYRQFSGKQVKVKYRDIQKFMVYIAL